MAHRTVSKFREWCEDGLVVVCPSCWGDGRSQPRDTYLCPTSYLIYVAGWCPRCESRGFLAPPGALSIVDGVHLDQGRLSPVNNQEGT